MVIQLVTPPHARLFRYFSGAGDHLLDQRFGDCAIVTWNILDGGAKRKHGPAFFVTERVGEDDVEAETKHSASERKRNAGRASGVFDDSSSLDKAPVTHRRLRPPRGPSGLSCSLSGWPTPT